MLSPDAKVHRLRGGLREAAGAFAPDAVHDNGLWLAHNHRIAEMARAIGLPRVVSTRGMLEPWAIGHRAWKKQLAWRLYQRRDLDRAAALHATAEPEAANLAQFGFAAPVSTIPNGVDIPPLTVRPALPECKARTALFLGRIYPVKGLPMLVEAWASVRPAGWRLVIAGPDEAGHKGVVERGVRAAGLGDVVRFAGAVSGDAKHALLAGADLFVLPSHSESFGMVVAEALAHGKPVLTTTAVPWPALQSRGCGWRTAPSTEGLAAGLREACACDDNRLREMGANGPLESPAAGRRESHRAGQGRDVQSRQLDQGPHGGQDDRGRRDAPALLKPGGTIIEGTSGNTGMGLAIAAVVKGYKCIFTTTDKQSKEKVDALKAFGAEVIVCPTNVDPEDPRSYYSVSSRLEQEVPELLEGEPVRQPVELRRRTTSRPGPEIWEQTDGRDHAPRRRRRHRRHDRRASAGT